MIYTTGLIEMRDSDLHGIGIFATQDIKKGDVIDYCPILRWKSPFPLPSTFDGYTHSDGHAEPDYQNLQLGYGAMYNSSHTADGVDAFPIFESTKEMYHWIALKDIPKDKEILTWYGNEFTLAEYGHDETLREWDLLEEILESLGIKFDEDGKQRRTLDNK